MIGWKNEMDKIKNFVRSKLPKSYIENHILEVVKESLWLAEFYPEADKEVVEVGALSHDVIHPLFGYNGDNHAMASSQTVSKYLESINFEEDKIMKIVHCIESHSTGKPPEPETIEAKIVASADNLTHFTRFDFLIKMWGFEKAREKIKNDLLSEFMLPEALDKAKKLSISIEKKYNIKILEE